MRSHAGGAVRRSVLVARLGDQVAGSRAFMAAALGEQVAVLDETRPDDV